MGNYGFQQLKDLWIQAGGSAATASVAAAVALAESGGVSTATNTNKNGSTDVGLWQINSGHGALATADPLANARAAVQLSNNGATWKPWCTAYTDGACGTKGGAYNIQSGSPVAFKLATYAAGGDIAGASGQVTADTIQGFTGAAVTDLVTSAWTGLISSAIMRIESDLGTVVSVILNNMFYGGLALTGLIMLAIGVVDLTGAGGAIAKVAGIAGKAAML